MAQVKNPSADAGNTRDLGSIPGLRRSPGEGNGNPLQYSCLENPTDRGAWQAIVHGASKSQTWLSNWTHTHIYIYTYLSIYLFIFNLKSLLANPSSLVNHFVMLNEISSRDSVDISARAKKKKKRVMFAINKWELLKDAFSLAVVISAWHYANAFISTMFSPCFWNGRFGNRLRAMCYLRF